MAPCSTLVPFALFAFLCAFAVLPGLLRREPGAALWGLEVALAAGLLDVVGMAVDGGGIEGAEARVAEGAVGGAAFGDGMLLQDGAVGRKDGDARARPADLPAAGGDDIAL